MERKRLKTKKSQRDVFDVDETVIQSGKHLAGSRGSSIKFYLKQRASDTKGHSGNVHGRFPFSLS